MQHSPAGECARAMVSRPLAHGPDEREPRRQTGPNRRSGQEARTGCVGAVAMQQTDAVRIDSAPGRRQRRMAREIGQASAGLSVGMTHREPPQSGGVLGRPHPARQPGKPRGQGSGGGVGVGCNQHQGRVWMAAVAERSEHTLERQANEAASRKRGLLRAGDRCRCGAISGHRCLGLLKGVSSPDSTMRQFAEHSAISVLPRHAGVFLRPMPRMPLS